MIGDSWTHKIARFFVLPLVDTSITPNHITTIRLITGLIACSAFAIEMNLLGGILWLIFIKIGDLFVVECPPKNSYKYSIIKLTV